ncbi:MAG: aminopeptidase [Acidobacteriota bacterium]
MQETTIDRNDLETWAAILLNHSLGGVGPGERVMLKGERIAWPLLEVLERRVIQAGAVPDVYLIPPNNDRGRVWSAAMGRHGQPEQLGAVPPWHLARYRSMTKYVEVLGAEDPASFSGLSTDSSQSLARADRPFADIRIAKPWVITLYPTPALAASEGLALEEYARFIVRASTTDPRTLLEGEQRLAPLIEGGRTVRIETEHPQDSRRLALTMNIEAGLARLSYGLRNLPDGEVYTSPDASSAEGEIYLDLPVSYGGHDIQGIYLAFEHGCITEFSAEAGLDQLRAIIGTDDGSHRLGEVALGMNPGLERVLKHPLFVEKVGGTLHIAIGASYEACFTADPGSPEGRARLAELEAAGVLNRSAQHVDLVADFRPGGCGRRVWIDGVELEVRDRVWVAGSAVA